MFAENLQELLVSKRKAKIRIREKYAIPGFLVAGHGFEPWTSGL